jgi:hypothetical protein
MCRFVRLCESIFKEMLELRERIFFTRLGIGVPLIRLLCQLTDPADVEKEAALRNQGCESHEKIMQQPLISGWIAAAMLPGKDV